MYVYMYIVYYMNITDYNLLRAVKLLKNKLRNLTNIKEKIIAELLRISFTCNTLNRKN